MAFTLSRETALVADKTSGMRKSSPIASSVRPTTPRADKSQNKRKEKEPQPNPAVGTSSCAPPACFVGLGCHGCFWGKLGHYINASTVKMQIGLE